ncbi:MAG: nucleotide sugar dehydrogenase [Methanobacteriaceae archaeon]|nr:nucleotide sugar dehydrogenase [Methanobacteriaceae archaeon]
MMIKDSKIAVYGLGHIGIPTAVLLAKNSFNVLGVDVNPKRVSEINNGICPITEPGLDELIKSTVNEGYLKATSNQIKAASECNIIIIIVPTPIYNDNKADLSYVTNACNNIKKGLKKNDLVIIESTIPPLTVDNIIKPILEESGLKSGTDFLLAYSPERALPNNTLFEMTHNVRVVGGVNLESVNKASKLYSYVTQGSIIKVENITSAEMVKLMENTYRDVNIALANEFALLCEDLSVDVIDVINAANFHPRVNIHTPGPGVGGHCISIDPYFLIDINKNNKINPSIIKTARTINESMPAHVIKILEENIGEIDDDYTIGILGVAYKGNVEDTRETPSAKVIELLNNKHYNVYAHDPFVEDNIIESFNVKSVTFKEALSCDCVILMTDHDLYKSITPDMILNKFFICTRPILDPKEFTKKSVNFKGIGRTN